MLSSSASVSNHTLKNDGKGSKAKWRCDGKLDFKLASRFAGAKCGFRLGRCLMSSRLTAVVVTLITINIL